MTTEDETLTAHESTAGLSVEAGLYPATVTAVEPETGQYGDQWKFVFALDEHPAEEAWAWATAKLGTKTKLFRWAGILLGRPLALGEQLGRAALVGKRCQVLIVDSVDATGETRRKVDDIMKAKTVAKVLEPAPVSAPPTPAPEPDETCYCGAPVASYSPGGEPLCAAHADDTEPEEPPVESEEPPKATVIPVKEMKSRFDFQREAHNHFEIKDLPAALHKAGFKTTMDVQDWEIAWRLLCEKMAEPA